MALPWMRSLEQRGPIVGSTESTSKKKQHNDVVYPVFLKCAELEKEVEWKELFTDLAYDRMPKGCNVRNKTLAYTDNYKTIPIRMDLEPEALREQLINLFSSKKGIARIEQEIPITPTVLPSNWSNVRRKIDKHIYILDYVFTEGSKMNWNKEIEDRVYFQISEWIEMGYIRQNEVTMVEGRITEVKDIKITNEGVSLVSQREKKCKNGIQVVHLTRLYQRLQRPIKKKEAPTQEVEEKSESTTV